MKYKLAIGVLLSILLLSSCYANNNESTTDVSSSGSETSSLDEKSPYQEFKNKHSDYQGDYNQYLEDYANGLLNEQYQYNVISYTRDLFGTIINDGSVTREANYLAFMEAVVKMDEKVIMPINKSSSWKVSFEGILNASGQYLASNYINNNPDGRIYFGINSTNGLFIGANIDGNFFNYCFNVPSDYLSANHRYEFTYEEGIYYLSIDGGNKNTFATKNANQTNSVDVIDAALASEELNEKIRAITGQDYFLIRYMGADGFTFKGKLQNLSIETGPIYNYKDLNKHPLNQKLIFQLGSSISYGHASSGRSFVEQIAQVTNSTYQKETVSGTTLALRSGFTNSYVDRYANFNFANKPDFLLVQLSTNDFVNNLNKGSVDEEEFDVNAFDKYTVSGAIEYIIAKTKELSPNTKVAFYSCPIKNSWTKRNDYKVFVDDYMRKIVDKWDIIFIDLFYKKYVSNYLFMSDDIHPNIIGYADAFTPNIINTFTNYLL